MKEIAIYGAGGLGREVACLINDINANTADDESKWHLLGFFDDGKQKGSQNEYGEVLGNIDDLNAWPRDLAIAIAVGSPKAILAISGKISNPKIYFPNILSPDVKWLDRQNVTIGKGNIICARCIVSCNVHIGDFNILDWRISIGHDSSIGNYNMLMPNVNVSGGVQIGDLNLFGAGSAIIQLCNVGNETIITANSVLYGNAKDGKTYMGNPSKKVKIL